MQNSDAKRPFDRTGWLKITVREPLPQFVQIRSVKLGVSQKFEAYPLRDGAEFNYELRPLDDPAYEWNATE